VTTMASNEGYLYEVVYTDTRDQHWHAGQPPAGWPPEPIAT